jgi:hypothetical protein
MNDKHVAERKLAVMQLKQGKTVVEVAQRMNLATKFEIVIAMINRHSKLQKT